MIYEQFKTEYRQRESELTRIAHVLDRRIAVGVEYLESLRPSIFRRASLFRIRIIEARVKDPWSVYWTIMNNPRTLSFEHWWKPGHIHDLIGARIVCHNLEDVEQLGAYLEQGEWPELECIAPKGRSKKWLKFANESGYRGWNLGVRWESTGSAKFDIAELQVRTILQDAWASFMHDDVYKSEARLLLRPAAYDHLKHFSDMLYTLDEMAQNLRTYAATHTVSSDSLITILETRENCMNGMVDVKNAGLRDEAYLTVYRRDRYTVGHGHATYNFKFKGKTVEPLPFVFPVAGDTGIDNCKKLRIGRITKEGTKWLKSNEYKKKQSRESPTVLLVIDSGRKKQHNYVIECKWEGIFKPPREYIWCPWKDMYPSAAMDYALAIRFEAPPREPPRLYSVKGVESLKTILAKFDEQTGGFEFAKTVTKKGYHEFKIRPTTAKENYICLFQAK